MSYYNFLGLNKEPFSTSPDPDFFYQSSQHNTALMRLMIEIRLRRGLSLILGDVGVGKTTLLRKVLQMVSQRPDIICTMILDPTFENEKEFLAGLIRAFQIDFEPNGATIAEYREAIKDFLFQKGVEESRIVLLLIDEAQKLNSDTLETLRTLLNYETNKYKLLQLVLLSQLEIMPKLKQMQNLLDRIDLKFILKPLNLEEAEELIHFRLYKAGLPRNNNLFTHDAVQAIYEVTSGSPRKITMLCHHALEEVVMHNLRRVDRSLIQDLTLAESMTLNVR
ncbi:ExeA family protein [Candidatus Omnitrophota bacterium]